MSIQITSSNVQSGTNIVFFGIIMLIVNAPNMNKHAKATYIGISLEMIKNMIM